MEERAGPGGLGWLRSGTGVAFLVGGGALLVAGLIALGDKGNQASVSPSSP
jgi:hypothetical protein